MVIMKSTSTRATYTLRSTAIRTSEVIAIVSQQLPKLALHTLRPMAASIAVDLVTQVNTMPYVSSTAIGRIEWEDGMLTIWLKNNSTGYDSPDVPRAVYEDFLNASSKGEFFNDHIRDQYS